MKLPKGIRWFSLASLLLVLLIFTSGCTESMIVLDPKGPIAAQQRDLIYIATILVSIVIVPVLIMTGVIVWRYRERKGSTAKYKPEWSHSTKLEMIWWGIPILIIVILGAVTVKYSYSLEPSKPIESEKEAITIQVTSLDWKWLFQYPEQGIATVNYVAFPEGVPVHFEITADSPMNSFWIPQLGGQIYAMSGMAMNLYLQADEAGEYWGSGANFTGKDFAKMYFDVHATSQEEFDAWVADVKNNAPALTDEGYNELRKQGESEQLKFSSFPDQLFEKTVTKYGSSHNHHQQATGSELEEEHQHEHEQH